jgi:hypothetical protein
MGTEAGVLVRRTGIRRNAGDLYPPCGIQSSSAGVRGNNSADGALTSEQEKVLLEHLPIARFLARRIHE